MKKAAIVLFITATALWLPSCRSALALDSLFPDKLFNMNLFSKFSFEQPAISTSNRERRASESARAEKEMVLRADEQMRSQMQKVAAWLQEFSLRNQNRFPGVYGDWATIGRAALVQLTKLVGGNPYAQGWNGVQSLKLVGLAPPLEYYYNNDGTPVRSSPYADDEWTSELTAENAHRIQLQMDQSASDSQLDTMRADPPLTMQAAPGTITGCGNGQGYIYVWGAGKDGTPVKDFEGKPYIISTQTPNRVLDQMQEAGY